MYLRQQPTQNTNKKFNQKLIHLQEINIIVEFK